MKALQRSFAFGRKASSISTRETRRAWLWERVVGEGKQYAELRETLRKVYSFFSGKSETS
jgi:hypothetical protein